MTAKATQLGTVVSIYEYVFNTIEASVYHGSRSGSVNTFLGQRGSDVDIATTLIAMLRSQKIPARYAVGTVRIPTAQLNNWLGI
ncbi:transglutaminase-like domain-containing protein, partial [Acinetobacter baumannii]